MSRALRDRDKHAEKVTVVPLRCFFRFFMSDTWEHAWRLASDRTLLPPFARPSSIRVSSASLRVYAGSHYILLGVPIDIGQREGRAKVTFISQMHTRFLIGRVNESIRWQ
jgi:hypothetical protein